MPELRFSFDLDADDVASALGTKDTVALATACLQQLGSSEQHEAISNGLNEDERAELLENLCKPVAERVVDDLSSMTNDQQIKAIRSALTHNELESLFEGLRSDFED